jgi:serine/threonine protein kinase
MDLGIEGLSDAEPVGAGGNAVVYRAREVDHDRWVAVKVLRGLADEAALRRFDRERRAMGRLARPRRSSTGSSPPSMVPR